MPIEVGAVAPDFVLKDQNNQQVRLSDFRGQKNVLVVFYPLAFTPTCTGEICALRDEGAALSNDAAQVLAVSCDPTSALRVFSEQQGVTYPLLSDFWPHGEVSRRYGVFVEDRGIAMRATFIIDKHGTVRWSVVHPGGEPRDPHEYERALATLG